MSEILLCVNIDHAATVRQARLGIEPNLKEVAICAQIAGANGITVHLREDRRHIQEQDLFDLKEVIQGKFTLEMAVNEDILQIAKAVKPHLLTLVPEHREELTTEGGLNVIDQQSKIKDFIQQAKDSGLQTSLFLDPDMKQIECAKEIGASRIELHTGPYANGVPNALEDLKGAAKFAHSLGFMVNAGHGLSAKNVLQLVQTVPNLQELHIGHALIARAIFVGISQAIKEIKMLMQSIDK